MRRSQTVFYNFLRVERSELEILVVAVLQRSQAQSMCGASMQSTTIGDGDENEGDRNLDGYCWLGADLRLGQLLTWQSRHAPSSQPWQQRGYHLELHKHGQDSFLRP